MLRRQAIFMVLTLAIAAAHAQDPPSTDAQRLASSLLAWQQLRDAVKGNYHYRVSRSSFTGWRRVTTVTVHDNRVTQRQLDSYEPGSSTPKRLWTETAAKLNAHLAEGAAPLTVDALYARATELLATPAPPHYKRYLAFNEQGILRYCFQVNTRIMDDAPREGVPEFELHFN